MSITDRVHVDTAYAQAYAGMLASDAAETVTCHRQMPDKERLSSVNSPKTVLARWQYACTQDLCNPVTQLRTRHLRGGKKRLPRDCSLPTERGNMTDQTDGIRAMLRDKRAELLRSIRSQSSQLSVSEGENDLIDRMQSMCSRDEAVTFLGALTRTLTDVDAALAAMDQGSYGICVDCEEPIASRRLQTIPWASHCIRCQEARERRQAHHAAPLWDKAA